MPEYPWYEIVSGAEVEQGDILRGCQVYFPPDDLPTDETAQGDPSVVEFEWVERDVVVMSQTCDLVKGREKVREVLLCAHWGCNEVGGHLATEKGKEDARRGNLPAYHMLAECQLPGFQSDVAGDAWMAGISEEWADDFSDPRQDIYTLADGEPVRES